MGMIIQNGKIFATGGADNFSIIDVLWSGTAGSAETITLNSNYDNYDLIIFKGYNTNATTYSSMAFSTNSLELNTNTLLVVDNSTASTDRRIFAKFTEKNKLTITSAENGSQIKEIIGIKLNGGVSDYHEYSTNERIVGKWIDGSTLYEKTVDCGALPNNSSKQVAHGITNIDKIVNVTGIAYSTSLGTALQLAYPQKSSNSDYVVEMSVNATNIDISTFRDRTSFNGYVTVRYTKSSSNTRSLNLSKGSSDETKSEEPVEEKKSEELIKDEES